MMWQHANSWIDTSHLLRSTLGQAQYQNTRPLKMKAVFRNVFSAVSRSLNPNPHSSFFLPTLRTFSSIILPPSPFPFRNNAFRLLSATSHSSSMAEDGTSSSVEKQFESFRCQLEESGGLRERVRAIAMEIESATRLMHANLLLVHQSRSVPGTANCTSTVFEFRLVSENFEKEGGRVPRNG